MEKKKELLKNDNRFNNDLTQNKNIEYSQEDLFFYVMTLQTDNGEKHEIKIYENSNASELAFNFCKNYNLDFSTMKYLKKFIKQIIQQFQNNQNKETVYFLKDNNSIQEVAEEEIITDNSLKKSGTIKKSNNNNQNNNQNQSKESIDKLNDIKINISNINKSIYLNNKVKENNYYNNSILNDINKKENKVNEFDLMKSNKSIEVEDDIEQKEYSIDYQLDNDSLENFQPTEHTTKIEQRSSIRNNSSSLTKNSRYDKYFFDRKNFSKNKKVQISGKKSKSISSNKTFNKKSYSTNYQKIKKESDIINNKNITNEFNINKRKKSFSKRNILNTVNNNDNNFIKKKPQSFGKYTKKINIRTPLLELGQYNRKSEVMNANRQNYKNKYDKFITNMNEMKGKYFSNCYNYFLKSRNICNLSRNSIIQKYQYQISSSINQESSKSKSISQKKINKNLTQKSFHRTRIKRGKERDKNKDKSMTELNPKNLSNSSKINLNTLLKKEDKHKTILKNKMKANYNITYTSNALLNKNKNNIMKKRNNSWKRKKGNKEKEIFGEKNKYGIKKMVSGSLSNIHKLKDSQEKKISIVTDRVTKEMQTKNNNIKNRELFNKFFRNEKNNDSNKNVKNTHNKLYNEFRNKQNNNYILHHKNNRNNTDVNYIQNSLRNECKGSILTFYKHN